MTRQLRRVAIAMFVLFAALFVNLNYLQVIQAETLAEDNRNSRGLIREYTTRRGPIIAQAPGPGGQPAELQIARVEETDGPLRFLRRYDEGPLFAHATGYHSVVYGRTEIEDAFNAYLVGSAPETFARNLGDLLAGRERQGDTVITALRQPVQAAARQALGNRSGAVVAIDPRTGELLALVSAPTYDPNELAGHDPQAVQEAYARLLANPGRPLVNRAVRETYPPGSTFKVVTAAAALESGLTPEEVFPDPRTFDVPQTTADIGNFGQGLCNGGNPLTLERALEVSCNTVFADLGVRLGPDTLIAQAEAFGFNKEFDFGLPSPQRSQIPKELDVPATAQSAIGQRDVRATPLQMAMVTGAIAFDGVLMSPRLVVQVEDVAGRVIRQFPAEPLRLTGRNDAQAISPETASQLTEMMVGVVERGSGTRAQIPGVRVAGKTGTAQTGEGRPPVVWFIGFAPADDPQVAVAVVIEDGGEVGDEATGGRVAAPVAQQVLQAALAGG